MKILREIYRLRNTCWLYLFSNVQEIVMALYSRLAHPLCYNEIVIGGYFSVLICHILQILSFIVIILKS